MKPMLDEKEKVDFLKFMNGLFPLRTPLTPYFVPNPGRTPTRKGQNF
jgi:hypothetical protein